MVTTLKDVAQVAGVSPVTVSHVLSGRTTTRVSDQTRVRIKSAAEDLDYRPNPIARSLRTRRTASIGVVVSSSSANIFAAEDIAADKGYELLLGVTRWRAKVQQNEIRRLLYRRVDGLLLISPALEDDNRNLIKTLLAKKFPVIVVGVAPPVDGIDYVDWDRAGTFRKMAEHLLGRGCRKMVYFCGPMTPGARARLDGIRSAIESHADASVELISSLGQYHENPNPERMIDVVRGSIGSNWPDAIICQTDKFALAAIYAAKAAGLRVPEDIAITGGSGSEFGQLIDVPLTTTQNVSTQMVQKATEHLIKKIENPRHAEGQLKVVLPAEIIISQSSLFGKKRETSARQTEGNSR